jgi:hypothetical protein
MLPPSPADSPVGLQEIDSRHEVRSGALRILLASLQGLGFLDGSSGGSSVPVGGERDEPFGGETIAHALEEGYKPPPGVQDDDPGSASAFWHREVACHRPAVDVKLHHSFLFCSVDAALIVCTPFCLPRVNGELVAAERG